MPVTGILGKKIGMTQVFDEKGDVHPITVRCKRVPASLPNSEDLGQGWLYCGADWPGRVRQGFQGDQADGWALCQEQCSPEGRADARGLALRLPAGKGSTDAETAEDSLRCSRQAIRSWWIFSAIRNTSMSLVPARDAALPVSYAGITLAADLRRTVTCSKCRAPSGRRPSPRASFPDSACRVTFRTGDRVTVRNLRIRGIDVEENLLMVEGAIPGPRDGYVLISEVQGAATRASRIWRRGAR